MCDARRIRLGFALALCANVFLLLRSYGPGAADSPAASVPVADLGPWSHHALKDAKDHQSSAPDEPKQPPEANPPEAAQAEPTEAKKTENDAHKTTAPPESKPPTTAAKTPRTGGKTAPAALIPTKAPTNDTVVQLESNGTIPTSTTTTPSPLQNVAVSVNETDIAMAVVEAENPMVLEGGEWSPPSPREKLKTVVVVPFRDREPHLRVFLRHMHPFLRRQQLHYRILVVEQVDGGNFNRAKLMNVGAAISAQLGDGYDCLVFHDVDLLPENAGVPYSCDGTRPSHLAVAMNKFKYSLPYDQYFGGVISVTRELLRKMRGFPNDFWGWGGEDDDIGYRAKFAGLKWFRPPKDVARYKMIKHKRDKGNPDNPKRFSLLKQSKAKWSAKDDLKDVEYRLVAIEPHKLYTRAKVDLLPPKKP